MVAPTHVRDLSLRLRHHQDLKPYLKKKRRGCLAQRAVHTVHLANGSWCSRCDRTQRVDGQPTCDLTGRGNGHGSADRLAATGARKALPRTAHVQPDADSPLNQLAHRSQLTTQQKTALISVGRQSTGVRCTVRSSALVSSRLSRRMRLVTTGRTVAQPPASNTPIATPTAG